MVERVARYVAAERMVPAEGEHPGRASASRHQPARRRIGWPPSGGSVGQIIGNKGRIAGQEGVASMSLAKTALTAAALGVTAYSRMLGRTVASETQMPAKSGTEAESGTPPPVAAAQRKLAALQWVVPALTGALVVMSSLAGEQQRAMEQHKGMLDRFTP